MVTELCETNHQQFTASSNEVMEVSSAPAKAVFTLSFGGVNFQLTPLLKTDNAVTNVPLLSVESSSGEANDVVLNLSSFSGTLRVSMDSEGTRTTAKVEEEPSSPVPLNQPTAGTQVSPGQQILTFATKKSKAPETNARAESATLRAAALFTPNVTLHPKGMPAAPSKKDGHQSHPKRAIPEMETSPPSPVQRKKSRRRENDAIDSNPNLDVSLGQISQLSQTAPSESSTDNDTDRDVTGIIDSGVPNDNSELLPSSINTTNTLQDDQSSTSSRNMDKDSASVDEENTIVEPEDASVAEDTNLSTLETEPNSSPLKGPPPPSPRWGHTMTAIDHDRILVYGGQSIDTKAAKTQTLSDLHVYDVARGSWYQPVNCEGVPRQWHSATFLPDRQLLISFGGESPNPKTGKVTTTDQVMVLDTEIMLWYPPSVSGAIPSGRSGHTATLFPNSNELVVFGGVKGTKWQNSVAVLDVARWKWSSPKIGGDAPRPRSYHSATAVSGNGQSNRLVIFGGNDRASSFNTIHILETDGKKWIWSHPKASGTIPPPRTGHCATLLDDKKSILVYGGWDPNADDEDMDNDEEMIFSDSYVLDTDTWTWSAGPRPEFSGDENVVKNGGERRVGHKSVLTTGKDITQVLVFGGRIPNDQFAGDFQTLTVPESIVGLSG